MTHERSSRVDVEDDSNKLVDVDQLDGLLGPPRQSGCTQMDLVRAFTVLLFRLLVMGLS